MIYAKMPRQSPGGACGVSRRSAMGRGKVCIGGWVCDIYMLWASVLVWDGPGSMSVSVSFPAQFRTLSRALSLPLASPFPSTPLPLCCPCSPSLCSPPHPHARPHTHNSPQGTMTAPCHLPFSNVVHPPLGAVSWRFRPIGPTRHPSTAKFRVWFPRSARRA